jgi:hypothetical protein
MQKKCNNQIETAYFGPLPYIELDPHTWPFIVGCNEDLNSRFPNAIRMHNCNAGGIEPSSVYKISKNSSKTNNK